MARHRIIPRADPNKAGTQRRLDAALPDPERRAALQRAVEFADYLALRTAEAHARLAELDALLDRL